MDRSMSVMFTTSITATMYNCRSVEQPGPCRNQAGKPTVARSSLPFTKWYTSGAGGQKFSEFLQILSKFQYNLKNKETKTKFTHTIY